MYSRIRAQNNKRKCRYFVVPSNGQALLSMPDIDMLNILKVNIHAIGADQTRGSDNCCTKMHAIQGDDLKQETVKLRSAAQT